MQTKASFESFPQAQGFQHFFLLLSNAFALLTLADVVLAWLYPSTSLQERGHGARSAPAGRAPQRALPLPMKVLQIAFLMLSFPHESLWFD